MSRRERTRVLVLALFLGGLLAGMVATYALRAPSQPGALDRTVVASDSLAARVAGLETEVEAARSSHLYLMLDAGTGRATLACRGVTLWSRTVLFRQLPQAAGSLGALHAERLVSKSPSSAAAAGEAPSGADFGTLFFERTVVHLQLDDEPALPASDSRAAAGLRRWRERGLHRSMPTAGLVQSESRLAVALSPVDARTLLRSLDPGSLLVVRGL